MGAERLRPWADCEDGPVRRAVAPLLAVTVALVLADSAVVTLALPDILRHLDTSVGQVAWVLISFNLVLGLAAVPIAIVFARAQPRFFTAVGIAVFAGSSAWCALAGSIEVLVAARCLQALGGALALVGCLELLVADVRRAARRRDLGDGRRGRHGDRAGRGRTAHRRRSRGRPSSGCRCRSRCWRCRPRSPYAPSPRSRRTGIVRPCAPT